MPGDVYEIVYLSDRTLVRFTGEVDAAMTGLNDLADQAIASHKAVVVDVRGVTFMDSVGCGFLARLIVGTKPHRVRVVGANEQISRLLQRMGMPQYLDLITDDTTGDGGVVVEPGLEAAVAAEVEAAEGRRS